MNSIHSNYTKKRVSEQFFQFQSCLTYYTKEMKNGISAYRVITKPRFSKKSTIGNFSGARLLDFSVVGLLFEVVLLLFFFFPPKSCPDRLRRSSQLLQCPSLAGSCYFKSTTSPLLPGRHGSPWHGRHSWERQLHFSAHAPIKLSGSLFREHFSSNASVHLPGSRDGSQNPQVQQRLVA